jgi:hypothetical protein
MTRHDSPPVRICSIHAATGERGLEIRPLVLPAHCRRRDSFAGLSHTRELESLDTIILMKHFLLIVMLLSFTGASFAQEEAETIIQRSVELNERDWNAAPEYDCFERDQQLNGDTKTFEDLMIRGSPYQRLVAINGKPLSTVRQAEEQAKLDTVILERGNESESERATRIAKYEKDRERDHLFMEQLTKAFHFTLMSDQKLDGYDVYVLKATPKADYEPPNLEAEVLKGMQGQLWIDKQTFQWVKVQAQVIRPVSIEGFLAQVQPGTRFEVEKMPVDDSIWLFKHFSMRSQAKILFFFTRRSQEDDTFYDYRKATRPTAARGK